jgi:hypothetical protein
MILADKDLSDTTVPVSDNDVFAYPESWEETCMWDGELSVHFGYASDGWVLMSLLTTAYLGHEVVHCSDVYDPFWDLVDWLDKIAKNDLPASITIDEEGVTKDLIASEYSGRFSRFSDLEFRIVQNSWSPDTEQWEKSRRFLCRCKRVQLVHEFASRLKRWLRYDYDKSHWNRSIQEDDPTNRYGDLNNLGIDRILKRIRKEIRIKEEALRADHPKD